MAFKLFIDYKLVASELRRLNFNLRKRFDFHTFFFMNKGKNKNGRD